MCGSRIKSCDQADEAQHDPHSTEHGLGDLPGKEPGPAERPAEDGVTDGSRGGHERHLRPCNQLQR